MTNQNSSTARMSQLVNRYLRSARLAQRWAFMEYERGNNPDGDIYARHAQVYYIHAENLRELLDDSEFTRARNYHILNA